MRCKHITHRGLQCQQEALIKYYCIQHYWMVKNKKKDESLKKDQILRQFGFSESLFEKD